MLACGPGAAAADVPDPAKRGPHEVEALEYDAGSMTVRSLGQTFDQRLRGTLHLPVGIGPWRVLVFVHGIHKTCIDDQDQDFFPSGDNPVCDDDGRETRIRSYAGYAYLADFMASRGYAVMSIDGNEIYDAPLADGGYEARMQSIHESLDLLNRWNRGVGPEPIGTRLVGKLEMHEPIGLMGHSRGGEAVAGYSTYAVGAESFTRHYDIGVAVGLAATSFVADPATLYTNLVEILPTCDGDVVTLEGAQTFEKAKYRAAAFGSARTQWELTGANHNFFNTVWTLDEAEPVYDADDQCGKTVPGSDRLSSRAQRRAAQRLMAAAFGYFVGGDRRLEPWVTGARSFDNVRTSYIAPAEARRTLLRPRAGTRFDARGFARLEVCDQPPTGRGGCPDTNRTQFRPINRSVTRQLTVAWRRAARLSLPVQGSVARFRTFTLRAATNWFSKLNPAGREQDFHVVLVDGRGREAAVRAARFSDALVPPRGDINSHVVLNGVRIPLAAFDGVDLARIRRVELRFGELTRRGSIQLADVAFQETR